MNAIQIEIVQNTLIRSKDPSTYVLGSHLFPENRRVSNTPDYLVTEFVPKGTP